MHAERRQLAAGLGALCALAAAEALSSLASHPARGLLHDGAGAAGELLFVCGSWWGWGAAVALGAALGAGFGGAGGGGRPAVALVAACGALGAVAASTGARGDPLLGALGGVMRSAAALALPAVLDARVAAVPALAALLGATAVAAGAAAARVLPERVAVGTAVLLAFCGVGALRASGPEAHDSPTRPLAPPQQCAPLHAALRGRRLAAAAYGCFDAAYAVYVIGRSQSVGWGVGLLLVVPRLMGTAAWMRGRWGVGSLTAVVVAAACAMLGPWLWDPHAGALVPCYAVLEFAAGAFAPGAARMRRCVPPRVRARRCRRAARS